MAGAVLIRPIGEDERADWNPLWDGYLAFYKTALTQDVSDPRMIYGIEDMARGDCLFAATGVTTGSLLSGVKFRKGVIETETVVMRSVTGTVRYIKAEHRQLEKFHLD